MEWTKAQEAAIETEGDDLLVAAGAGSGKTAVLVARILRKILGENTTPCDVDRLLIVTFTKAAAQEMRQRLFEALDARLYKSDVTEELAKRIYVQQTLLARATITTIHGFCTKVILNNSKESGIDGSFTVGDDAEIDALFQECAEDVCEAYSQSHSTPYEGLVDTYASYRSDDELVELIKKIALFALAFPEPKKWIRENAAQFQSLDDHDLTETVWGQTLIRNLRVEMQAQKVAVEQLYRITLFHQVAPYLKTLEDDRAQFSKAVDALSEPNLSWVDAQQALEQIQMTKLGMLSAKAKDALSPDGKAAVAGFSDRRTAIKKQLATIQKRYFSPDVPGPLLQADVLKEDVVLLGEMACSLIDTFAAKKRESHLLDYNDLEHIAYHVLKNDQPDGTYVPSDVALRYQSQFKEIFIDEYQDTNLIQEAILTLVSGKWNGTPNLFMVGDIKQSVYGFRQACPDLFLDKYLRYRDVREGKSNGNGARVCLYKNFRSRKAILDTVNGVFRGLMRQNTCGMDYTEEEYLNYGANYYDRVEIKPEDPVPQPQTEVVLVNKQGFDYELLPELHEVARRIQTLIEEGYPVYDKRTERMRPICYGDICILLRSAKKHARVFGDYLMLQNIPAVCPEKSNFFKRPEVQVLFSFLKVLDNPRQDIPLIAVLRNIYGISDDVLAQIKLEVPEKGLCFWDRVLRYSVANQGAVAHSVARIQALRIETRDCTIGETVWKCMHENGFFDALRTLPNGEIARQNLLLLMNRAVQYDTNTNKGLYTFVHRLEALEKGKKKVEGAGLAEDGLNAVQIMTIHGSKGLEFPVVFLCNAGAEREKKDESDKLLLHRDLGFGPTCYDREKRFIYPSIMRLAVRQQMALDNKAEELRVLYVALTRAKEKLFVIGTISEDAGSYIESKKRCCDEDGGLPLDYYVLHTDNYLALLVMALGCHISDAYVIRPAAYTQELDVSQQVSKDQLLYTYELPTMPPYKGDVSVQGSSVQIAPAKVSVSQLGDLEKDDSMVSVDVPAQKGPKNLTEDPGGTQIGTLLHSALQQADYSRMSSDRVEMESYAKELLQTMVDNGFMTAEDQALVPVSVLVDYFTSDFALALSRNVWMMREVPFTFLRPWKELTGEDLPGETAVQGVMDCIAEIDGKLLLVDFKSDRITRNFTAYSERYLSQISVYREACLRAFGKAPDEIYLYYLRAGHPERIVL